MKQVNDVNCLSRARLYERFKRLKEGHEDINDDEHPGQKSFVIAPSNIEISSVVCVVFLAYFITKKKTNYIC